MTMIPTTYEIDSTTGEATGIAHPYCSLKCQAADISNIREPYSAEPSGGEALPDDCMCETCGASCGVNPSGVG